jgi:hypothetical protein
MDFEPTTDLIQRLEAEKKRKTDESTKSEEMWSKVLTNDEKREFSSGKLVEDKADEDDDYDVSHQLPPFFLIVFLCANFSYSCPPIQKPTFMLLASAPPSAPSPKKRRTSHRGAGIEDSVSISTLSCESTSFPNH